MKYGRLRSISARQIGKTAPSAFCSSVTPHRRSTSDQATPRVSHSRRSCGKIRLTSSSRSCCMSQNVDDTNTRIERNDEESAGIARLCQGRSGPFGEPYTRRMRLWPRHWHPETWVCSMRGHITPAADALAVGPADAAMGAVLADGRRLARCLRCDTWIEHKPPNEASAKWATLPPLAELAKPRRGK